MTHLLIALLLTAEPDARAIELTPTAHEARVELRTCEKNLSDCEAKDRVEFKWVIVTAIVSGVACAGIAFGAGYAAAKR